MTYSYHHLVTNLLLDGVPPFTGLVHAGVISSCSENPYHEILAYLNGLAPKQSFFYREFAPAGTPLNGCPARKYFTSENAERIDVIREKINEWIESGIISASEESLLKHTLIMAVNEIANISGTYGYFLSDFKKNATEQLQLNDVDRNNVNNQELICSEEFPEGKGEFLSLLTFEEQVCDDLNDEHASNEHSRHHIVLHGFSIKQKDTEYHT